MTRRLAAADEGHYPPAPGYASGAVVLLLLVAALLLALALLLGRRDGAAVGGGSPYGESEHGVPEHLRGDPVDVDGLYAHVAQLVRRRVPGAGFRSVSASGTCGAGPQRPTTVAFFFLRADRLLVTWRKTDIRALVDVDAGTVTVNVRDLSRFAISEDTRPFQGGAAVTEALRLAQQEASALGGEPCEATVSLFGEDWSGRCGAWGAGAESRCRFDIVGGHVENLRR